MAWARPQSQPFKALDEAMSMPPRIRELRMSLEKSWGHRKLNLVSEAACQRLFSPPTFRKG